MSTATTPTPAQESPPLPSFRAGDVEVMWEYLRSGFDLIMSESFIPHPYYMELYACVFSYCTEPSRLVRKDLYLRLETYLAAHVAAIPPLSAEASAEDDTLLRAYAATFGGFSKKTKLLDRLCSYLNRHWVKPEQDWGAEVYTVYSLALKVWQEDYLATAQAPGHRLTSALLRIIDKARHDGGESDPTLFKAIVTSLVDVSSESATPRDSAQRQPGPPKPRKKSRTIYKAHLLEPLAASTRAYYDEEAASHFDNHTLGAHVLQVAEWLKAEEKISKTFFDGNQRTVGIAEDVLIQSKFDVLKTEADRLLKLPLAEASKELVSILTMMARLSKEPAVAQGVLMDWNDLSSNPQVMESQDSASLYQRTLDMLATCSSPVEKD